jgi:hypothetical protein
MNGTFSYKIKKDKTTTVTGNYRVYRSSPGRKINFTWSIIIDQWHYRLHSETGPATIDENGIKRWFLNGKNYTKIQWLDKLGK